MKTLTKIIYIAALALVASVSFGQTKPQTIVKTFHCHDQYSNIHDAKIKTIDSLKKLGFKVQGFRVDYTFKQKGFNTQVFTFYKAN